MSTGSCHHTDKILSYEKQINHGFLADWLPFYTTINFNMKANIKNHPPRS